MSLRVDLDLSAKGFDSPLNLEIKEHGVTAIFGPSGCGKTSLLRSISGLDHHPNSSVYFDDECWQNNTDFLPTYQRGLSYVFQEPSLFFHLSVQENLEFGLQRSRSANRNHASADKKDVIGSSRVNEMLNIGHLLGRATATLSGGEAQRVAIARALRAHPRLLLMDEPLSALDSNHKAEIIPLLEQVCQHSAVPIIYVSHSIDEVARLADNLVLMEQGAVIAHAKTAEVLAQLDLPIAQQPDSAGIIDGLVLKQEPEFALTHIETPAGKLCITDAEHLKLGAAVRLKLCARDVSIALDVSAQSSILNVLPATLMEMHELNDAQVLAKLNANGVPLLARITKKSRHLLNLEVGQSLMLQIKSIALL